MYAHKHVWLCGWRGKRTGGERDRERQRGRETNHRSFPREDGLKGVRPIAQQIIYLRYFN